MKKTMMLSVLFLSGFTLFAQNTNVLKETETTITTIKDSKGERKIEKVTEIKETQPVELEISEQKGKNIPMKESVPVNVATTTKVAVDGQTEYVDVDHSSYYMYNGEKYEIKNDEKGYIFYRNGKETNSILRKASGGYYLYIYKNDVSIARFDKNGDLVIESYDKKKDTVTIEKYTVLKP
ncbi:hypothetical protein [Flavobacterium sediminis]|nr:hypothetical protein [Flavobacterium sediminis]